MSDTIAMILTTVTVSAVVIGFYIMLKRGVKYAASILGWKSKETKEKAETPQKQEKGPEDKAKEQSLASQILGVIVFGGLVWYFFGGGLDQQVSNDMQKIQNKVAADSVAQYGIALRNGTAMDRCVQAGMVTAAYLQAQDEENYQKWKIVEANDCASAGVPR